MDDQKVLEIINTSGFRMEPDSDLPNVVVKYNKVVKKESLETLPKGAEKASSKSVIMYYDCNTQKSYYTKKEIEENVSKPFVIFEKNTYGITRTFYKYLEDIDCLCIETLVFSTNINVKVGWEIRSTSIITRQKTIFTRWSSNYSISCFNKTSYIDETTDVFDSPARYYSTLSPNAIAEVRKMFPVFNTGGNSFEFFDGTVWKFKNFLRYKEPTVKNGPKQKKINELVALPISEIKKEDIEKVRLGVVDEHERTKKVSKLERVGDYCCVRYFFVDGYTKDFFEGARIYVDNKNVFACRKNTNGDWINISLSLSQNHFTTDKFLKFNKEILKDTKLQYYGEIIKEIPERYRSCIIWAFLAYPNTEILYKSELKDLFMHYIKNSYYNLNESFKDNGIKLKQKAKNIYNLTGLNKYQLQRYIKYVKSDTNGWRSPRTHVLNHIKIALGTYSVASYGNDIFDKVFDALASRYDANNGGWRFSANFFAECLGDIRDMYSLKTMLNMCDPLLGLANKFINSSRYGYTFSEPAFSVFADYIDMVKHITDGNKFFKPQFKDLEQLAIMHDNAVEVYNFQEEKYKIDAFKKRIPYWEKYKFEDKKFTVIIPNEPMDLAKEGNELHHCVKSYIDRVTDGITNICFIRKNDELDKPFFTVEITNDNSIQQVHGFGNRNADTENGLVEFVKKWAKERKLKLTNFNKIR